VQGHLAEALQAAQQAFAENPFNAAAYAEAESSMIGLDRYQGAMQLQDQARKLGVVRGANALSAAYLSGDKEALARQVGLVAGPSGGMAASLGMRADYGLYLDNEGRIAAGSAAWQSASAGAAGNSDMRSGLAAARASMLAFAALDRALIKSCSQAIGIANEAENLKQGMAARFDIGMAFALCGDKAGAERAIAALKAGHPESTAVNGFYVADLTAAEALSSNDTKGALAALGTASAFDQISLTPYLRGLAHLGSGEAALAVADFQTIVDHRGAAFLAGSNVYPMAQIGLARAYAAIGDKANSTAAYQNFLVLWRDADKGQAMLAEASKKR
jgi:hypothetical protein